MYTWPDGAEIFFHSGVASPRSEYRRRKVVASIASFISASTSSCVGQMSPMYTSLPSLRLAERLGAEVFQHRAGDRVGHHQRRTGEEVGADVGVDARLEVAVAREHRGADQVVLDDRLLDRSRQRAGVADAGGAAVAGEIEAEFLEIGQQAGLGQVFGHHARARRERGLDVRLDREPVFDRLLREQSGGEQHAGVGGVGAGGDRGDQHVAGADVDAVGWS